jgi:tRNA pseudouridine38-40 synthase
LPPYNQETSLRLFLTLEYDGGPFHGWQHQPGLATVQGSLEKALEQLFGQPIAVCGAGRTDAGVHARGQVAHVNLPRPFAPEKLPLALNHLLGPVPISVLSAWPEPERHARFSASQRYYRYLMLNRRARPVLEAGRMWWIPRPLNVAAMHQAAQSFIGSHDFTSFRSQQCQAAHALRSIDSCQVSQHGEQVVMEVKARSFLHSQVRIMAGTLAEIGLGYRPVQAVAEALEAKKRSSAGQTAPPEGLYFWSVTY